MPIPSNDTPETSHPGKPSGRGPNKTRLKAEDVKDIIPEYRDIGLTIREARFAAEYLTNGFNATQAYLDGVDPKATRKKAGVQGHLLVQKSEVRQALAAYMKNWLSEKREKLETSVISVLWARAFYDPAMFINAEGEPTFSDWDEVPKAWRVCVDGIEKKWFGRDADRSAVTFKLANRDSALEKLARYISMFSADNVDHNFNMTRETEERLQRIFQGINPLQQGNNGGKGKRSGVSVAARAPETRGSEDDF